MDLAQRRCNDLDLRMPRHHLIDHRQEDARIQLRAGSDLRAGEAEALLQVLFVADQHVDVLDDRAQHLMRALHPADRLPKLLAVVQVERADHPSRLRRLHRFNHQLRRRLRQRGEDAAAVEPAHALAEDRLPVEVARLQQRRRFVAAVVEHHRRAHAEPWSLYTVAMFGPRVPSCSKRL